MDEVRLETERLILRMFRESDFKQYSKICADPEVMRFLRSAGKPPTAFEVWRQMAFFIGHWQFRGYGMWAVEEKASGDLVGRIGFLYPAGWPDFELGWTLRRESWGRGYATEGARRALDYAFAELKREHVISLINKDNLASIRVAERIGERLEGKTDLMGQEVLVYGVERSDVDKPPHK